MATITVVPEYPIPKQALKISFGSLNASTNFVQVFALTAPEGSEVRKRIDASLRERPRVHEGPSSVDWDFTPDIGGVYRFRIQEEEHQSASSAMFQHDPAGAAQPEVLATSTVSLHVGQKLQLTVGASPNTAQLRLYVWDDTVRPTTAEVHGEDTPGLFNPTTTIARNAAANGTVQAFVDALANETADDIVGDIDDIFEDLRVRYNQHIGSTTYHSNADTANTIGGGYVATNAVSAESAINEIRRKLRAHMANEGGDFHGAVDGDHQFITSGAGRDPVSQLAALADTISAFEGHLAIVSPVHLVQDTTSVLDPISPLLEVHRRFLEALITRFPTVPVEINEGVAVLAQKGGFSEVTR